MAEDIDSVERIYTSSSGDSRNDYSKQPYMPSHYPYKRGITDFGNLFQFAPFEGGFCFISVLGSPAIWSNDDKPKSEGFSRNNYYQQAFIRILETEFKGLSGIEDISTETTDAVATPLLNIPYILKVNSLNVGQFTMSFTEKSGSILTKYISLFLKTIRAPYTNIKSYDGRLTTEDVYMATIGRETFDLLYIITDATCLNVEKAFLILNAQPTSASYSEIYNVTKGDISVKEISIPWSGCVREGAVANRLARKYMEELVATIDNPDGLININSYDFDWSISGLKDYKTVKSSSNKVYEGLNITEEEV